MPGSMEMSRNTLGLLLDAGEREEGAVSPLIKKSSIHLGELENEFCALFHIVVFKSVGSFALCDSHPTFQILP